MGTEIAHVTRDSDTTFEVKRSKVMVTRPLYSARPWRVRRLQRSAWELIRRGKVLLRCVCSAAREALGRPRRRWGAGAYCVATRTACLFRSQCSSPEQVGRNVEWSWGGRTAVEWE